MAIQNLEQKRLIYSQNQTTRSGKNSSNYDAMIKKVAAFIQTNGLLYTLAYLKEKDEAVFEDIQKWHTEEHNVLSFAANTKNDKGEFLKATFALTDDKVRLLTLETLALFKCLKRFVKDE